MVTPCTQEHHNSTHDYYSNPCSVASTNTTSTTSSCSRGAKSSSRAHLVHLTILQKKAILVIGLPERTLETTKMVEREFRKFGVITNCIINPRGLSVLGVGVKRNNNHHDTNNDYAYDESTQKGGNRGGGGGGCTTRNRTVYYIKFLHEKSALNAIEAIRGQMWWGDDVRIHACFVNNRYCDEFVNGRYCQDLDCIDLHETIKNTPTSSTSSTAPVKKHNKPSYISYRGGVTMKTPKTTTKSSQRCWKSPQKSLHVVTKSRNKPLVPRQDSGVLLSLHHDDHRTNRSSWYPPPPPHMVHRKSSNDGKMKVMSGDKNQMNHQRVISPNNASMKKTISARHKSVKILSATNCEHNRRHTFPVDLPARKLFQNKLTSPVHSNKIIAPPKTTVETWGGKNNTEGIDSPWGIKSPFMIEKDNFSNNKSHISKDTKKDSFQCQNSVILDRYVSSSYSYNSFCDSVQVSSFGHFQPFSYNGSFMGEMYNGVYTHPGVNCSFTFPGIEGNSGYHYNGSAHHHGYYGGNMYSNQQFFLSL
jgi:hypothetical protein